MKPYDEIQGNLSNLRKDIKVAVDHPLYSTLNILDALLQAVHKDLQDIKAKVDAQSVDDQPNA